MFKFFLQVYRLTKPAKGRLAMGIICGVLSGLADPAMFAAAYFVLKILFPAVEVPGLSAATATSANTSGIKKYFRDLQESILTHAQTYMHDHPTRWALVAVVSIIPLVMLARCIITYLYAYLMNWVVVRALANLRARAFEHLLNLPLSFFGANSTGELMARVTDINYLQNVVGNSILVLISEPVRLIAYLTTIIVLQPKLTLCVAIFCPIIILPISVYSRKGRKAAVAAQSNAAGLSRLMHESFTGNRIIKAYSLEPEVSNRFRTETAKYISYFMRTVRATETPGPVIEFTGSIGMAILLFYFALQPSARVEDFAAFVVAVFMMYRPIKALVRLHSQMAQAHGATQRIMDLLATKSNLTNPPQPKPLKAAGADIHFDNVSFGYGDKLVVKNIQLRVKPGEKVAFVGKSGSGKTTVANLLLRFYDPCSGAVRIGGVDVRDVSLEDLRKQMAVVTQEVILFDESIATNIGLGRAGATKEQIAEAARNAFAHDFIMEKPNGYQTNVGEKGVNLSGGQKQRIAIARALLRDAPILVLDEATSALDNEGERAVQAALDELTKGRTTICIAHRLSTIQNFDRIVVMDAGQIVEIGTHTELLAKGDVYAKLYALGASLEGGI